MSDCEQHLSGRDTWQASRLRMVWTLMTADNGGQRAYAIRCAHTGYVKLGAARDPRDRLGALQVGCPTKLELLAVFGGGTRAERELHDAFDRQRVRGEWFSLSAADISFLSAAATEFSAACWLQMAALARECTWSDRASLARELDAPAEPTGGAPRHGTKKRRARAPTRLRGPELRDLFRSNMRKILDAKAGA